MPHGHVLSEPVRLILVSFRPISPFMVSDDLETLASRCGLLNLDLPSDFHVGLWRKVK